MKECDDDGCRMLTVIDEVLVFLEMLCHHVEHLHGECTLESNYIAQGAILV